MLEEKNPLPNEMGQRFFMTKNLDTIEHIIDGITEGGESS